MQERSGNVKLVSVCQHQTATIVNIIQYYLLSKGIITITGD